MGTWSSTSVCDRHPGLNKQVWIKTNFIRIPSRGEQRLTSKSYVDTVHDLARLARAQVTGLCSGRPRGPSIHRTPARGGEALPLLPLAILRPSGWGGYYPSPVNRADTLTAHIKAFTGAYIERRISPFTRVSAKPQRCARIMRVQPCQLHTHISMLSWVCERGSGGIMRTDGLCMLYIPGGCFSDSFGRR